MAVAEIDSEASAGILDTALMSIDIGVPGAILRVALGFLLLSTLHLFTPAPGGWIVVGSLLLALFALKASTAIARRVLPVSAVVRSQWKWRRDLASHHDSYQWRKLLWIGSGILVGASLGDSGAATGDWTVGAACVLAGGVAELVWRHQHLSVTPPLAA